MLCLFEGGLMKRLSRPSRTPAQLLDSTNRRLNMYTLSATAAGVGVLALAQPAEAKIVYTPIHRIIGPNGYYTLDLNHDGKVDFVLARTKVSDGTYVRSDLIVDPYLANSANGVTATAFGTDRQAIALRAGARIGPKGLFNNGRITEMAGHGTVSRTNHYSYWVGQWGNGGKGLKNRYLGLKFNVNGKVHFGWARVTVTTRGKRFTGILTGYAYETIPNKSIIAGKTKGPDDEAVAEQISRASTPRPQAPTLGLLAMGSRGLSIWRRKQSAEPTQW